jgi:hypothetical protein
MASSGRCENLSKKKVFGEKISLTYLRYLDHVLFRNCDPSEIKPAIRETVGWVIFESPEAMWICSDKPFETLPNEKNLGTGFIILKSVILEQHRLSFDKAFKRSNIVYCGQEKPYKMEN